jgi:large subunit ribosomal protein L13
MTVLTWFKLSLYNMDEQKRKSSKIDATGKSVGRLASEVATLLIGKHRVDYMPNMDMGNFVRVENAAQMKVTGKNKMKQKTYYRHSGYAGGLKEETLQSLWAKNPSEVLRRSVSRMIPKNKLRNERMKRLTIKN